MTITIKSDGYTAEIDLTHGANCISLRNETYNTKILREHHGKTPSNPYLYGMPVLFPSNRISGGEFEFEGRKYRFPINEPDTNCALHGKLHALPFEAAEVKSDFIKCVFSSKYLDFPHEISIEISYKLCAKGLEQRTKITNLSNENMPNFLGFHTTFNIPFVSGTSPEDIRIYAESGSEIERDENYLPTGRILAEDEFYKKINSATLMPFEMKFSKHCAAAGNGKIEIRDLKNNLNVVYENDEKFNYRLFYNGNADEYVCLEPMNCAVNAVNAPLKSQNLPPLWRAIPKRTSEEYVSRIYLTHGT